jgi:SprT protein
MTTVYELQKKLHVSQETKNQVETAVLDCILMAEKVFGKGIPVPEIKYDLVGRAAGQAIYDRYGKVKHTIRINPILLNENPQYIILQTVPHEMAHVVVSTFYEDRGIQVKGHGYEWQRTMRLFGLEPHRCHNLDISSVRAVKRQSEYHFKCRCEGKVFKLSKNKYTRWSNGVGYQCPVCKSPIRFDKVVKP